MNDKVLSIIIKAQDQASKVMDQVGENASHLGGVITKALKLAAAALATGTTAAVGFAIKSAASFEQTRIGLENMLGSADAARKVLSEVSKFAAQTPFEFPELAASVKQLVAFGFSGVDAVKTMKQLGDVSAAIGAPIGDLAYLMGTLKTQGRAFTIDIRQFAQRGVPIYEYLAKVLNTNTQEINKMIEAGKIGFPEVARAFEAMTAEGGKFHGAMAKQSQSLSGLWSTLKDNIGLAAREMVGITQEGDVKAGSLFDRLRIGVGDLIVQLDKIDWAKVSAAAMDMVGSIVGAITDAGSAIVRFLAPAFQAVADVIRNVTIPAIADFFAWFRQVDPVVQVALSPLLALAANFRDLNGFIGNVVGQVQNLWTKFTESTPVIIFTQFLRDVLGPMIGAIGGVIMNEMVPALAEWWGAVRRLWDSLNPALTEALKIVGGIILGLFIGAIVAAVAIIYFWVKAFTFITEVISLVIGWISNLISWVGNLVGIWINGWGTMISIARNFFPAVRDVIGSVIGLFAGLGGMILGAIGNFGGLLYNAGRSLIQGLVNGIKDAFGSIGSSITGGIKGALHAAKIPGFATGGYTGRGGTNEVAGIVHRGEYVVPRNQVDQSTGLPMTGGATFNMYGSVNLGSAGAVDRFFERLNAQREMANLGVGV